MPRFYYISKKRRGLLHGKDTGTVKFIKLKISIKVILHRLLSNICNRIFDNIVNYKILSQSENEKKGGKLVGEYSLEQVAIYLAKRIHARKNVQTHPHMLPT